MGDSCLSYYRGNFSAYIGAYCEGMDGMTRKWQTPEEMGQDKRDFGVYEASDITISTRTQETETLTIVPDSNEHDINCEKCNKILISWRTRITLCCSLVCPCGHTMKYYYTPEINITATIALQ